MQASTAAAPSPLRNRAFLELLSYRILAMLSYQIVAVTVGWHIYEITRDPLALGLVGLAEVIPYFCVAPFAGYSVDHLPRRQLGAIACAGLAITALMLAGDRAGWSRSRGTWLIYVAIALTGTVRSFLTPIYNTLFARVLPREQFARGAGLGSVVFQLGLVLGPALGGVLVAWAGKTAAYGLAAAFALAAAVGAAARCA